MLSLPFLAPCLGHLFHSPVFSWSISVSWTILHCGNAWRSLPAVLPGPAALFLWELVLGVWRWSTRNKGLQFGAGQARQFCQGIVQLRWLSKLLGALFLSEHEWMMFAVINYHKLSNSNITDLLLYRSGGQESKSSSLDLSQGCHESFEAVGETQCLTSSCWGLLGPPWETTSVSAVCHDIASSSICRQVSLFL